MFNIPKEGRRLLAGSYKVLTGKVRIRHLGVFIGAHEVGHYFSVYGTEEAVGPATVTKIAQTE